MLSKEELSTFMKDHTNQEAAKHFNVNVRTIARWLKSYGLYYYELKHGDKPKSLSDIQREVFVGTMLGDASILKDGRYRFKQCIAHQEYVEHIHSMMQPFSTNMLSDWTRRPSNTNNKVIDLETWNGDWLESRYFVTFRTPFFKQERKNWYVGKRKILPNDLQLTPRTCYYWALDDGSNRPIRKEFILSTQGFTNLEVDRLIYLLRKLGINANKQIRKSGPIIAIYKSYFDWMELITPYSTVNCFNYKLDISDAKIAKEGWHPGKIGMRKAQEIRMLYGTDKYTQKQLAKIYGVSVAIIWRIINDKIYRKINPGFGGSANVHITYKVEACPSGIRTDHFSN